MKITDKNIDSLLREMYEKRGVDMTNVDHFWKSQFTQGPRGINSTGIFMYEPVIKNPKPKPAPMEKSKWWIKRIFQTDYKLLNYDEFIFIGVKDVVTLDELTEYYISKHGS